MTIKHPAGDTDGRSGDPRKPLEPQGMIKNKVFTGLICDNDYPNLNN